LLDEISSIKPLRYGTAHWLAKLPQFLASVRPVVCYIGLVFKMIPKDEQGARLQRRSDVFERR
jgi:hypothetical protein